MFGEEYVKNSQSYLSYRIPYVCWIKISFCQEKYHSPKFLKVISDHVCELREIILTWFKQVLSLMRISPIKLAQAEVEKYLTHISVHSIEAAMLANFARFILIVSTFTRGQQRTE